jgi:hypothetical protein
MMRKKPAFKFSTMMSLSFNFLLTMDHKLRLVIITLHKIMSTSKVLKNLMMKITWTLLRS